MNRTMLATHRIMDSVWTLRYEICDKDNYSYDRTDMTDKIRIIEYNSIQKVGYEMEGEVPECQVMASNEKRIVDMVYIYPRDMNGNKSGRTIVYEVVNPGYIFSYR